MNNKVTVSYNTLNQTYDVFDGEVCVFYGDFISVTKWLSDNNYRESRTTLNEYLKSGQTSEQKPVLAD